MTEPPSFAASDSVPVHAGAGAHGELSRGTSTSADLAGKASSHEFELRPKWVRLESIGSLATIVALFLAGLSEFQAGSNQMFMVIALAIFVPIAIGNVKRLIAPPVLRIRGGRLEFPNGTPISTPTENVADVRFTGLGLVLPLFDVQAVQTSDSHRQKLAALAAKGGIGLNFPDVPFGEYLKLRAALGLPSEPADPTAKTDDAYFREMQAKGGKGGLALALVGLLVGIWLWQIASGVDALNPTPKILADWGGNVPPRTIDGEYGRLISCWFLHAGFIHLFVNVVALRRIGVRAERLFGALAFLAIYGFGGIVGALASTVFHPQGVCVGASGAIFAIIGAIGRIGIRPPAGTPSYLANRLGTEAFNIVVLNVLLTIGNSSIDQAAHFGGALAGLVAAMLLGDFRASRSRRTAAVAALAVAAVGLTIAVIHQAEKYDGAAFAFARALNRMDTEEEAALAAFREGAQRLEKGTLDARQFAEVLDRDVIPRWQRCFEPVIAGWEARLPAQLAVRDRIKTYYQHRLDGFRQLRDGLRSNSPRLIDEANASFKKAQSVLDNSRK